MSNLPMWLFHSRNGNYPQDGWGANLKYSTATPSTNSIAMDLLSQQVEEGTIVITDHQTQGRGQKGTSWLSSPGENLTFSIILRPQLIEQRLFALTQTIAIALREAIEPLCPDARVQIKWPNDILVNHKKIAGVLIESQWEGSKIKGSVVGIGLNVNQVDFPDEIIHKTTSLALINGKAFDRGSILWSVLLRLKIWYEKLIIGENPGRAYLSGLYGYQEAVALRWNDGEGKHQVLGVNALGHVAIQLSGRIRHFDLKEIEFILP
ncbi:MAG: biotin--[acetyl-CoA-carboxylase] ligase [Bacteroidia bacterium]|nr:biotin--[acetyl-CoA-carboxylase] ligase [Bacteroidia bacterium]